MPRAPDGCSGARDADLRAGRDRWLAWWFTRALTCYPPDFRARFGPAMQRAFLDQIYARNADGGRLAAFLTALRSLLNTSTNGLGERRLARTRRRVRGRRELLRTLAQDLRFALRMARRQPLISLLSIATLAVGIGSATAVFSLVDASLVRDLPLPAASRLVAVMETAKNTPSQVSWENLLDWKRQSLTFDALTPFRGQSVNLTGLDTPERIRGGFVTSDFFPLVAVAPALGRRLVPGDDEKNAAPVVVINHGPWQRLLGGGPDVIGRVIHLNNVAFTVVGVMPAGFYFPYDGVDAWLPMRFFPGTLNRSARTLTVFGRLAPGATVDRAQAELEGIASALAREYPATNAGRGALVRPLHDWLSAGGRDQLTLIFALVLVLLAAACANVTSLQIGATVTRRHEIAVRAALGAGRLRIARQLLTEHIMIAIVAGGLGLALARTLVPWIVSSTVPLFGLDRATVDVRVVLFGVAITMLAGVASGLMPAVHWAGQAPADFLRAASRSIGERRLTRARAVLVAGQVGMAAVLLTTTGLLVKSYRAITEIDPGFRGEHVQTLEYRLPANKYTDPRQQVLFHQAVADRAAAIPGVRRVAVARGLPLSGNGDVVGVRTERMTAKDDPLPTWFNTVSDGYFGALAIPLLQGRTFDVRDGALAPLVTVVSNTFAKRTWPGENPIGRDFEVAGYPARPRVIGVVGDVRQFNLVDEVLPAIYARSAQNPGIFMTLVVLADGAPEPLSGAMRRAVWDVDPDQPVWKERSLASLVDASFAADRFQSGALATFAAAAVLLVIAGLYGVVSQSVSQRSREIGVRMVLGAQRGALLRHVLAGGLKLTAAGLVLGQGGALLTSRLMQEMLYRTSPQDALPYATTAVGLGIVAAAACYLPARRAASVDPTIVLRD